MSSFNVTWSKTKPPGTKVFARKRLIKPTTKTEIGIKSNTKQEKTLSLKGISKQTKAEKPLLAGSQSNSSTQQNNVNLGSKDESTKQKRFIKGFNKADRQKPSFSKPQTNINAFDSQQIFVKRKHKKDKQASTTGTIDTSKMIPPTSLFSEKHKDVHINARKGKSLVEKIFSPEKKFTDLPIHKHLLSNINKMNLISLTNVQEKSIPEILLGKNVLVRSQTGSGKTLVYAVPIMEALQSISPKLQRKDGVQAVIIVPTRELALQTHELFGKLNTFQWLVVGHLCGGENRKTEKDRLRKGVHILIATPGRLLDHILHTNAFKLNKVRCLVLDEADRLLDMGFKKDIVKIVEELDQAKVNATYNPLALLKGEKDEPKNEFANDTMPLKNLENNNRQTVLLSATLTKGISELAEFAMKDHIYIDALDESATVNEDHMIIPSSVKQNFVLTYVKRRLCTLSAMLVAQSKQKSKTFVFMATSQMVDYHHELFVNYLLKMPVNRGKLKSGDILLLDEMNEDEFDEEEQVLDVELFKLHGNMDQSQRKEIFTKFRRVEKGILICTDVAARGIDVPEADCIIQYTGPATDDDYLHRVGRTGRVGKSGSAFLFLTHEEQDYVTRLQERKVFLQEYDPENFLRHLCDLMEEPDLERAATALQRRYEAALNKDKELHRKACFAYTSWSRFYNTYPSKMREYFDFKKVHLGHYVTSFGLRDTPAAVARVVRGQVTKTEPKRLNKKLATHKDEEQNSKKPPPKRKIKSLSLTTSEFGSGLEPTKKKKKSHIQQL